MISRNIALVSLSARVGFGEIAEVAGAVLRQVNEHFSPIWNHNASITPYASVEDVPLGYWRVTIVEGKPQQLKGIHLARDNNTGQPYALVSDEGEWSIAVSHEILEMIVDPTFSELRAGYLPGGQRVSFLVEVCDPCQAITYTVNGCAVSDFITPEYFEPDSRNDGRFSYYGSIKQPHTVAPYGYLVWVDPIDNQYYAFTSNGRTNRTIRLGTFEGGVGGMSLRFWVDSRLRSIELPISSRDRTTLRKLKSQHRKASEMSGRAWLAQVQKQFPKLKLTSPSQKRQPK